MPSFWRLIVFSALLATCATAPPACGADAQPDASMMRPIRSLRAAMEKFGGVMPRDVFSPGGNTIVENFPPYLFQGPDAEKKWWAGFKAHAVSGQLSKLQATFGSARDFDRNGERAFFTLPTVWTGLSKGHHFIEHGGWAFVLIRGRMGWRVKAYAWAVTR